jgi:hypothetical protein
MSDAWPAIGTTVPKVAAREGMVALARAAASAIEIGQQFQRIYGVLERYDLMPVGRRNQ